MSRYENERDDDRYENQRDDDRYERDDDHHTYVVTPSPAATVVATRARVDIDDRYELDDRYDLNDDRNDRSDRYEPNDEHNAISATANVVAGSFTHTETDDDYDGQAFRLYMAALDRTPDPAGLANWTNVLRSGTDLDDVARGFVTSVEFESRYGSLSDSEYVTQLYQNVLNRAPDSAGYANWMSHLSAGESRETVLIGFSESTENRLQAEALLNGVDYQSWVG